LSVPLPVFRFIISSQPSNNSVRLCLIIWPRTPSIKENCHERAASPTCLCYSSWLDFLV